MKRILLCAASLLMVGSLVGAAQAQEPSGTTDQTMQAPSNPPSSTTDPATSTMAPSTTDPASGDNSLPATASPWPLAGAIGLASLAAGLAIPARRPKS